MTGVGRDQWTIRMGKGEYPVQIRLNYSTKAKPPKPFAFDHFQIYNGELHLTVKCPDAKTKLDESVIDWDGFSDALSGLYATVMRHAGPHDAGGQDQSDPADRLRIRHLRMQVRHDRRHSRRWGPSNYSEIERHPFGLEGTAGVGMRPIDFRQITDREPRSLSCNRS